MNPDTEMWPQGGQRSPDPANPDPADPAGDPTPRPPTDPTDPHTPRQPWEEPPAHDPAFPDTSPLPRADEVDGLDDTLVQPAPPAPPAGRGDDAGSGGRGRRWSPVLASALVAAIVSTLVTLGITRAVQDDGPAAEQQAPAVGAPDEAGGSAADVRQAGGSVAEVAQTVLPSVARVDVNGSAGSGSGSAVVYSEDGYLITNNHVVEGAANVTVTLPDTQVVDAEVVGTDATSDLAVLEIAQTGLTPPGFAAGQPRPGDGAIAIGSPFGLDSTVTSGIISATEREVNAPGVTLVGLLQTDAAINPGNSGGALVNDRGELIGINTAILSQTGQSGGIGFAIPVSTVRDVADQLINQGEVQYAYLGVSTQDLNQGVAEQLGLDSAQDGALVADVEPGSAADDAGLERGDVIIALGDEEVTSSGDLVSAVRSSSPGDPGTLTFLRDGEEQEAEFTFGTLPSQG